MMILKQLAANTKPQKDKFAAKGIKCVFLGYPPAQKGYKLYNLSTHEVFLSRDVSFEEHVFPFKDTNSSPTPPIIPSNDPFIIEDQEEIPSPILTLPVVPFPCSSPIINDSNLPNSNISIPLAPLRKSSRTTGKPRWLDDFVTTTKSNKNAYPLFHNSSLPTEHNVFLAKVFSTF